MAKAWSKCGYCGKNIYRYQYTEAGQYLVITTNGHLQPKWFCNKDCLLGHANLRIITLKVKIIPLKPFDYKKRLK